MQRKIIWLLLIFTGLYSCKEDNLLTSECASPSVPQLSSFEYLNLSEALDSCYTFPPSGPIGYNETYEDTMYLNPFSNPNNPNQFVYAKHIENNSFPKSKELWKFDISTGEHSFVTDITSYQFRVGAWGESDWILLNSLSLNIWKVKPNGDSLTQITFDGGMYYPYWINNGTQIICSTTGAFGKRILDIEGQIIDTIEQLSVVVADNNGKVAGLINDPNFVDPKFGFMNLESNEFTTLFIYDLDENGPIVTIDWLDDETIIWTDHDVGIWSININTLEKKLIKASCEDHRLYHASVIQDQSRNYLLLGRMVSHYTGANNLHAVRELSIFDLTTEVEQIINF